MYIHFYQVIIIQLMGELFINYRNNGINFNIFNLISKGVNILYSG